MDWHFGEIATAQVKIAEAIAIAKKLNDMHGLAVALCHAAVIFREVHRHWPSFFRFPFPGYSLIAAHSGLCLDVLNGSTENSDALQEPPVRGRSSHLWALVPDQKGYNFIVNL